MQEWYETPASYIPQAEDAKGAGDYQPPTCDTPGTVWLALRRLPPAQPH